MRSARLRERLVAPLPPVDRVVLVLEEVRRGGIREPIRHVSCLPQTGGPHAGAETDVGPVRTTGGRAASGASGQTRPKAVRRGSADPTAVRRGQPSRGRAGRQGQRGTGARWARSTHSCRRRGVCSARRCGSWRGGGFGTVARDFLVVVWPGGPPSSIGRYSVMWSRSQARESRPQPGNTQWASRRTTASRIASGGSCWSTASVEVEVEDGSQGDLGAGCGETGEPVGEQLGGGGAELLDRGSPGRREVCQVCGGEVDVEVRRPPGAAGGCCVLATAERSRAYCGSARIPTARARRTSSSSCRRARGDRRRGG